MASIPVSRPGRQWLSRLISDQALRKTFELVAIKGPAQKDLDDLFAALDADPQNALDGIRDTPNQPIDDEPERVKDDLRVLSATHIEPQQQLRNG